MTNKFWVNVKIKLTPTNVFSVNKKSRLMGNGIGRYFASADDSGFNTFRYRKVSIQ